MLFNHDDYPAGHYVMHCPTYDDALDFFNYMVKAKYFSYAEANRMLDRYKRNVNNTCYRPKAEPKMECAYASLDFYRSEGYIILNAADFDFSDDNKLPDISIDSDDSAAFDRFISDFI